MPAAQVVTPPAQPAQQDDHKFVRLHITPLRPELLKVYLAPSILPLATNISYHTVETFPEKGYGYIELPEAEAKKIRNKLNGTTLRGSKVRIEMAKSEKRKAREEADAAKDKEEAERPSKRVKKEKKRKEQGVLEGVELPDERKIKRGWTEPSSKGKKERKEKREKTKDKEAKHEQKSSKYTKEPELLFKAKLTPVAATEVARKEKKKDKKEKKEKKEKKSKSREVTVHEFEKNTKTPSFLKETKVITSKKPPVEYINGQGWVDEDGIVVEPETGKARNRRVLELVDKPVETTPAKAAPPPAAKKTKEKKIRAPSPPESSDDESSVVSSSSEDSISDSDLSESDSESEVEEASTPKPFTPHTNGTTQHPSSSPAPAPSTEKPIHPLEALFKRAKPDSTTTTATPVKKLTPINTSFSFFDNTNPNATSDNEDNTSPRGSPIANPPVTPFTEKDLEWRGLRSAAPTPDTAAIGKRFSFDWRKGSAEVDDEDDSDSDVEGDDGAIRELNLNTKANTSQNKNRMMGIAEETEGAEDATGEAVGEPAENGMADVDGEEKEESQFRRWFWENRGDLNRSWKKRRREALKAKRLSENRKGAPMRRRVE